MRSPEPLDWKEFYRSLVLNRGLKPAEIAEMTLPELMLYSDAKKGETTMEMAVAKMNVLRTLSVEHHLALALIRSGAKP